MGIFFTAHGAGFVRVWIVKTCLLGDGHPVLQGIDLAQGLNLDGLFEKTKRVEVFDLAAGAEFDITEPSHRHIGIDPE